MAKKPAGKKSPAGGMRISYDALAASKARLASTSGASSVAMFRFPDFPASAVPKAKAERLAQDSSSVDLLAWAGSLYALSEGQTFLGYTLLSELAQRPEYRRMVESIANQMTRKWIRFTGSGDEEKADRVRELEDEMERLRARHVFKEAAEHDGFFGRSHVYLDLGTTDDRAELLTPIGSGDDDASRNKIGRGSLKALRNVEPVWVYPADYNSTDPLAADFYKPATWYVNGRPVHASRLMTFVGREVPDIFKPAYAFGGVPLTQMAKPYVDNWLRTRQSVADLIQAFSVMVFKTDLGDVLNAGRGEEFYKRLDIFNAVRNNRGVMALDKEDEDLENVAAPLGTLDVLQAQTQEHMASVSGIPLIFLLGISPTGLNASSDGEIATFYDWIHSFQEALFRKPLERVVRFAMLNIWGEVDRDIKFEFEKLRTLDDKEQSEVDEAEARTDDVYVGMGAIDPDDVRRRLAKDPKKRYSLDLSEAAPGPPVPPTQQATPGQPGFPGARPDGGAPGPVAPNGRTPAPPTPPPPKTRQ